MCLDDVVKENNIKIYKISKKLRSTLLFMHPITRDDIINYLGYKYYLYKLLNFRNFKFLTKFQDLRRYGLMLSGRFHGLCIAMMLGIPCLAVPSNTHKTESMLTDIGIDLEKYLISTESPISAFKEKTLAFLEMNHDQCLRHYNKYINDAQIKIEGMFKKIKDLS